MDQLREPGDRLPSLGSRGQGWVVLQVIGLAGVVVGLLDAGAWSGAVWRWTALLGGGLAGAGLVLAAVALLHLGSSLTPNPRPKDDATLVEHGVYARARHPIYGGLLLGATGLSLLAASPSSLLATAATAAVLVLKSLREEAWLVRRYDGYRAYRRRTRRFLPWLL
jgi:protein-S-isoprenylcysteine O-methyltransferase Ste14